MGYDGTPSKACLNCRRRKLRCDLHDSACGQCVRAELTCTGYRNPQLLRIRNETELVKRKAQGVSLRSVEYPIQIPLQERARAAFLRHYVYGFSRTYDILGRLSYAQIDMSLATSLDAVSLAFFSFQYNAGSALRPAKEKYLSALSSLQRSLCAPSCLASNSTFLAVLFLDLFEKIANRSPLSSATWMTHVRGAMTLAKLRDPIELKTYVGLRLSTRLFTNMLISCVAANASVPSELTRMHSELKLHLNTDDPKFKVSTLVLDYADFRGAVQQGALSSAVICLSAKRLDREFASLAENLPSSWRSTSVRSTALSPSPLESYYDVYPDSSTGQTCNVIRIMRILLNEIIRKEQDETVTSYRVADSMQTDSASWTIDTMSKEICASGPQFWCNPISPSSTGPQYPARKLESYTLLFPFYVAGKCASPDSGVRNWIVERLRFIADVYAMGNANLVADLLQRQQRPDPWTVYALLGSYAFAA